MIILVQAVCFLQLPASQVPNHLKHSSQATLRTRNRRSTFDPGHIQKRHSPHGRNFCQKDEQKPQSNVLFLTRLLSKVLGCDKYAAGTRVFLLIRYLRHAHQVFSTTEARPVLCTVALNTGSTKYWLNIVLKYFPVWKWRTTGIGEDWLLVNEHKRCFFDLRHVKSIGDICELLQPLETVTLRNTNLQSLGIVASQYAVGLPQASLCKTAKELQLKCHWFKGRGTVPWQWDWMPWMDLIQDRRHVHLQTQGPFSFCIINGSKH